MLHFFFENGENVKHFNLRQTFVMHFLKILIENYTGYIVCAFNYLLCKRHREKKTKIRSSRKVLDICHADAYCIVQLMVNLPDMD